MIGSGNVTISGVGEEVHTTHKPEESHEERDKCEPEEEMFSSSVHLAKVKSEGSLLTILVFTMFVMVVVVAKLSKYNVRPTNLILPSVNIM